MVRAGALSRSHSSSPASNQGAREAAQMKKLAHFLVYVWNVGGSASFVISAFHLLQSGAKRKSGLVASDM